ncbi:MAG: acyl-CoA thioesterase [Pseudomonadota bacterium]
MTSATQPHPAPKGELTTRTLAMPADTNPAGDIFGGWVVAEMDKAGAVCAATTAGGRVVTVAIDAMTFIQPVFVGDVLSVYCVITRTGRTSITVQLEAWALRDRIGEEVKVTEGTFTFVAVDDARKPRPISLEC